MPYYLIKKKFSENFLGSRKSSKLKFSLEIKMGKYCEENFSYKRKCIYSRTDPYLLVIQILKKKPDLFEHLPG